MKISKSQARLSVLFVVTQLGAWTGCNAILGNGYGVDDPAMDNDGAPSTDDGSVPTGDAVAVDGTSADGTTTIDGGPADGSHADGSTDGSVVDTGCPNNVCPTKLVSVVGPQRIALSPGTGVYWVTAGAVGFVDQADGGTKNLPLTGVIGAGLKRGVTVNAGIPYVTSPDSAGHGFGKCTANLSACTAFIGNAGQASTITTDTTNMYLGVYLDTSGVQGSIWRTLPDGSGTTLYSVMNNPAVDHVLDLQIVGSLTYLRTPTDINANTSSTAPAPIADLGGDPPSAFVVQGTSLLVTTTNNHIRQCGLSLGTCTATTAIKQLTVAAPTAIAADANHAYWAEGQAGGTIRRCDLPACDATTMTVMAAGQASPNHIVVDNVAAGSIYWSNYGDDAGAGGAIMKLSK